MIFRKRRPVAWELKITTPGGEVTSVYPSALADLWASSPHTTDGYVQAGRWGRYRLWARPDGWTEDYQQRLAAIDGTGALPDGMARRR